MELPGKRKRGRPKRRFMDVVKEDMAVVEVTEEDTVDRNNWRRKIRCGDGKAERRRSHIEVNEFCTDFGSSLETNDSFLNSIQSEYNILSHMGHSC